MAFLQIMPAGRLAVFSDCHVQHNEDPCLEKLIQQIEDLELQRHDTLVLLGDIFDFAVGIEPYLERYARFFDLLKSLHDRGIKLIYVEGNHDFDLKSLFKKKKLSGLELIENGSFTLDFGSKRYLFTHGDLVNKKDYGYRLLRFTLRTTAVRGLIQSLPHKWVMKIGERASHSSRKYNEPDLKTLQKIRKLYRNFACEKIQSGYDGVISGHNHLEDYFEVQIGGRKGVYVNPGFFPQDQKFILFDHTTNLPKLKKIKE
jgi:UDP-2,3-diacylglucosamine hydrolase